MRVPTNRYAIWEAVKGPATMFIGSPRECLARYPGVEEEQLCARGVAFVPLGCALGYLKASLSTLVDPDSAAARSLYLTFTRSPSASTSEVRKWLDENLADRPDLDPMLAWIACQQGALPIQLMGLLLVATEGVMEAEA